MPRFLPLGKYPAVWLEAARVAATEAWAQIYSGVDVARERRQERTAALGAMLFSELGADYLERTGKALVERFVFALSVLVYVGMDNWKKRGPYFPSLPKFSNRISAGEIEDRIA